MLNSLAAATHCLPQTSGARHSAAATWRHLLLTSRSQRLPVRQLSPPADLWTLPLGRYYLAPSLTDVQSRVISCRHLLRPPANRWSPPFSRHYIPLHLGVRCSPLTGPRVAALVSGSLAADCGGWQEAAVVRAEPQRSEEGDSR